MLQLLAQTDALSMDYWIDKGVMGALLVIILGFLGKVVWEVWIFFKPMAKEKHDSSVKLQETLTENSGKQTEILTCMKDSLTQHSQTCIMQQSLDAEAHDKACVALENIHHDLDLFRKEALDPNAPFSTVETNKRLDRFAGAWVMSLAVIEQGADRIADKELADHIRGECQKIKASLT